MKTFRIKDEDGTEYSVEEVEKKEVPAADEAPALSDDEISALKKLAAVADKLVALTSTNDEEKTIEKETEEALEDEDEDEDKDIDDEDEDVDVSEVIDTDEEEENECKAHDSKSSVGSLERYKTNDSIDVQEDITNAWAKRYGGNK